MKQNSHSVWLRDYKLCFFFVFITVLSTKQKQNHNHFLDEVSWLIWRKTKNIFQKGVNSLNGRLFKMYVCFCRYACHKKKRNSRNISKIFDQWPKFSVVGSGDFCLISKLFSMNVTTSSPLSVFVSLYFLCKYTQKHTKRQTNQSV